MSKKQMKKASVDWREKSEKVNDARKRGEPRPRSMGCRCSECTLIRRPKTRVTWNNDTAPPCGDGAGGDPCNGATPTTSSRAGSDPYALMAHPSAGGDATRAVVDEFPRMNVFRGRIVPEDHGGTRANSRSPSLLQKGSRSAHEAKKIPRAQAALDSEWKKHWCMKCWMAESATEYDEV